MAKNRVTVSSFKIKKENVHICIVVFPSRLYHTVITKNRRIYGHISFVQKPHTLARRVGKEIKARQRIQKYRKISKCNFHLRTGKKTVSVFCCQTCVVEALLQERSLFVFPVLLLGVLFFRSKGQVSSTEKHRGTPSGCSS